jgi:malonyl-CoA/methylmalonyl-CoA synthetase
VLKRWKPSERIAVYDDAAWTYAAIDSGARRLAHVLRHQHGGHLQGTRVAVLVPPGAHFVMAFLGVLMAGGCVIVLSPLHPPAETKYFCEDGEARAIVTSLSWLERTVGLGRPVVTMEAVLERGDTPLQIQYSDQDPALQLYTSGTTGKPKGAVHTHASLDIQQELLAEAWGLSQRDVLLHVLPLHHMHGLCIALLSTLGAGGAARMLPAFDAKNVWERMADATVFMAVPTIYAKLVAAFDEAGAPDRWQTSARRLRLMTSGSAALPVTIGERVRQIHGQYPLERFGMTEVGVAFSNPLVGERRPGSVGKLLRTFEMKIDDDGALHLRGPSVFSGYYRREKAIAEEGWFSTGDTAAVDGGGYVKILGRTSVDILKSGGYKLSALEIEEVLREHPGVKEIAVVGVPDETWGERVVACVIGDCREEELRAFAKEKLAGYKVPRAIVFMEELPRNALGKVVKPELVKRLTNL